MKNLNEELLRQLLLMNFDGSKTLLEQEVPKDVPSDRLGPKGDFQPSRTAPKFNPNKTDREIFEEDKQVALRVYNKIVNEIEGGWLPVSNLFEPKWDKFWRWGTDERGLTDVILSIKNQQQYSLLRLFLKEKYKNKFRGDEILEFIQGQEFSASVDPFTNTTLRDAEKSSGVYGGQRFQYDFNDKFLIPMERHLQKFNPNESLSIARTDSLVTRIFPPATSAAIHTILPVLTMVLAEFPPAAFAVELLDAGLYAAEGDTYSAGLGLCFALIPAGQFYIMSKRFSIAEKQTLMAKIQLKAVGKVANYTAKEAKLLLSLGEEGIQEMLKKAMWIKKVTQLMNRGMSINMLFRLVWWLVKKGFLPAKFLTKMGISIGGTFMAWDAIAAVLGVCNSMGLTELTKEEEGYLKAIGGSAAFLQRFSSPCERDRAKQLLRDGLDDLKKSVKDNVIEHLTVVTESGIVLTSSKFKTKKSMQALVAQIALRNLGYTKYTEITTPLGTYNLPLPTKTPTNVLPLPPQQTYDPTGGIGAARKVSGLPASGNPKLDSELTLKSSPIPSTKKVVDVVFRWGFYDYNTEMVVKEFQKKNNLKDDGELGPNTVRKLIEKIKPLSIMFEYDSGLKAIDNEKVIQLGEEVVKVFEPKPGEQTTVTEKTLEAPATAEQIKETKKNMTKEYLPNNDASIDSVNVNLGSEAWNLFKGQ